MNKQIEPNALRLDGYVLTGGTDGDPCHISHEDDSSVDMDCGTFDRAEGEQALREFVAIAAAFSS